MTYGPQDGAAPPRTGHEGIDGALVDLAEAAAGHDLDEQIDAGRQVLAALQKRLDRPSE
jgi:hypothetical protein